MARLVCGNHVALEVADLHGMGLEPGRTDAALAKLRAAGLADP